MPLHMAIDILQKRDMSVFTNQAGGAVLAKSIEEPQAEGLLAD